MLLIQLHQRFIYFTFGLALFLSGCSHKSDVAPGSDSVSATDSAAERISTAPEELNFYVSPSGAAGSPGTESEPFQTLFEARDALRGLSEADRKKNINIWLRGGTYKLNKTLVLSREDGAPEGAVVRYRAYPNEIPVLSSGRAVSGWKKLDSPVPGLPKASHGNVWVASVPVEEYGRFTALFTDGKRLPRAKSEKFQGDKPTGYIEADSRNVMYKKDRHLLRTIRYKEGAPINKNWDNLDDIEVFFNPVPWALNFIPIESLDFDKRLITLKYEANAPAFSHHGPYAWVENAVDFIDEPGEWAHNSKTGLLYYWPHNNQTPGNITVPQLKEFIRVEGDIDYDGMADVPVKNISFEGLTFTQGKRSTWYKDRKGWGIQHDWDTFDTGNAMLRFRGAENMQVTGSHFTNSAGSAIRLDLHAQNITIDNNLIDYMGHMGILLAGYGPGVKDVNHHNVIKNNIIHHVGEIIYHGHAIFVWQSGSNLISNNWIHDVPRKAIGICGVRSQILMKFNEDFDEAAQTIRWSEIDKNVTWNDDVQAHFTPYLHAKNNIIENNKVTKTLLKLSDGASINVSGAGEGNIVRHNYIYDVDFIAVRTDDWQRGTLTTKNIIVRAGTGVVHKDYNHITNNIFIDLNGEAIRMRAFPRQVFKPGSEIHNNIFFHQSQGFSPYGARDMWGTSEFKVSRPGKTLLPYEYKVDNNLYWFPGAKAFLKPHLAQGIEQHSVIADPLFKNVDALNLKLDVESPALKIGFQTFDTSLDSFGVTNEYPKRLLMLDSRKEQWHR